MTVGVDGWRCESEGIGGGGRGLGKQGECEWR